MLVTVPRNIKEIELLPKDASLLIGLPYLANNYNAHFTTADLEVIKEINPNIIIRADRLVPESEIDHYLELLNDYDYSFLVTDLGVLDFLLANKPNSLIIYNPETMITNTLDLECYLDFPNLVVGVSLEVPFSTWTKADRKRIYFQAFGLRKMFDSRRKVFSLYNAEKGISEEVKDITLVESSRNETYLAFEDQFGSVIYRPYFINYLDQTLDFGYVFLESIGVNSSDYLAVVNIYDRYLKQELTKEEALKLYNELNLKTDDGFKYVDSIYEK